MSSTATNDDMEHIKSSLEKFTPIYRFNILREEIKKLLTHSEATEQREDLEKQIDLIGYDCK